MARAQGARRKNCAKADSQTLQKHLKTQINSVGSTKKITSAMKMVAASKLKKSQEKSESAKPYSERIEEILYSLSKSKF